MLEQQLAKLLARNAPFSLGVEVAGWVAIAARGASYAVVFGQKVANS